jgi:hypothetical protein
MRGLLTSVSNLLRRNWKENNPQVRLVMWFKALRKVINIQKISVIGDVVFGKKKLCLV